MLTKTPDYIISAYGYPKWQAHDRQVQKPNSECKSQKYNGNHNNSKRCLQQATSPCRLLPLRETLTDYYTRLLLRDTVHQTDMLKPQPLHLREREQNASNSVKVQKNKTNEHIRAKNTCNSKYFATPTTTATTTQQSSDWHNVSTAAEQLHTTYDLNTF